MERKRVLHQHNRVIPVDAINSINKAAYRLTYEWMEKNNGESIERIIGSFYNKHTIDPELYEFLGSDLPSFNR